MVLFLKKPCIIVLLMYSVALREEHGKQFEKQSKIFFYSLLPVHSN